MIPFAWWELLHLYHILLNADDCLIHSLLKIFFTCIIYCYMQMIALYFPCWRASSRVSYIVTCRWLPSTFPAEELLHLFHILLHAGDCLILSLLKSLFTCIIYCYMQMIALLSLLLSPAEELKNYFTCIIYCYMQMIALNFPCWELLHLYHILLNADDCLIHSLLNIFFTCIIYCYMQMIAFYFPCWKLLHLYHILLHADDCLKLSPLKIFFTCIIYCYMEMIALYFPCWRAYSLISYIVTCRWLFFTFPAEELLHLYHILLHADDCLKLSLLRASSLVSYIVKCRWLPYTFPAEDLLHLYHILLHADDCLLLSLLKSYFTCIWYCSMQMIALYFPCWRSSSRVSYIVTCRWLPSTFPAEELLHLYHILLRADDCLKLSLLKSLFTCILYCYMQMIALYFPCWRAYSFVSYIVKCRWLPYTFPADDLPHVYHILLHADDCLKLTPLKIFFTCIIYCYMQMIALYFPCWRAYSLISYIVTCRWLFFTFPAEDLIHWYHILLHADDFHILSLLKIFFTCIIYCYMQMIAFYFACWRATSLVSYIVTCRWLHYTFPAEELLHLYHILLHADDCLILSPLKIFFTCIIYCYMQMIALIFHCWKAYSLVSYIVICRWLPYTFPAEELIHLYHILLHADDCILLSPLKNYFTCIIYCYMQMIALNFPRWRSSSLVSYIVTCRWLPYTFPAEDLLHVYHILLHADDCLILSLLKILFTGIIYCCMQMIAIYFPCWRSSSRVSYIVTCRWLPSTLPAEELLHLYHILLHADDCLILSLLKSYFTCIIYCYMQMIALYFSCWRSYSLVSYIVTCRWLPYTFPAEDLIHWYHILLHADDCLILSLLKIFFTCIIYCYMQMIALYFPCWRSYSLVSYIVACRWLPYTFPAEDLLHVYHILLHADDCLLLCLLKSYFTCIIYCYMQMIALYFPCWRASSLVSYIVACRWLPYTFPAEDLLHLYHILLHADDCLNLSLLKSLFTCIIYCYMQMIALYFPCWRAYSLISYIVTCRWLYFTFPAEELLHLYHILLHADDCLKLSPLKIFFTCIIYCYMQMIALYFPCWRSSSRVSYIVTCRWLLSTFPAEELLHLYHILLHADDCLILSLLKSLFTYIRYCYMQMIVFYFPCWKTTSLVSYIVKCRWLPYTFPAEDLLHVYHILLHADDWLILSLLKSFFTCFIYCYMQLIALYFPCWRASSLVSYIFTCRWFPSTFPAEELLHLYHILLLADDCLKLFLLKSLFTCIIYCYMQMIALYFSCWRSYSLVSYIVTCRWLPYTFPAEDLIHWYHILLHADDCLILSLLKIFFTCIIYCYMQMIAFYFTCWRATSLVSYIVTCRWLP